ncbi:hypothetical protein BCR33DRAFT_723491 [Rhizoclosmatium globosum]|uniref:Uncharacterized protein n=1 Tax=Rhizoclosmatium globosum TaxID=329046 RepID=A0A1Y2BCB3_9FUNG|nr:hypothetical protein BCR33DRAFT_723491 [Rhizoclosmatium globosum]|eukprot:ORY32472.1 hypothetical protein BCR33DRAFT_723491 [Rhizoclosmatium globosum]
MTTSPPPPGTYSYVNTICNGAIPKGTPTRPWRDGCLATFTLSSDPQHQTGDIQPALFPPKEGCGPADLTGRVAMYFPAPVRSWGFGTLVDTNTDSHGNLINPDLLVFAVAWFAGKNQPSCKVYWKLDSKTVPQNPQLPSSAAGLAASKLVPISSAAPSGTSGAAINNVAVSTFTATIHIPHSTTSSIPSSKKSGSSRLKLPFLFVLAVSCFLLNP